jgi:hypothetical protein
MIAQWSYCDCLWYVVAPFFAIGWLGLWTSLWLYVRFWSISPIVYADFTAISILEIENIFLKLLHRCASTVICGSSENLNVKVAANLMAKTSMFGIT